MPSRNVRHVQFEDGRPLLAPLVGQQIQQREELEEIAQARTKRKAICLLPVVVVTYFIAYIVCHVEIGPYIYNKIAKEYNGSHMSSENPCTPNMSRPSSNSSEKKIQNIIQDRVATLEMYLGLTTFLVAILPVVVLGPLTDTFGRKVGFLFPIVGTFLKNVACALIIWLDLPLGLLFVAHMFEALGGAFAAMLTTMFSVISDVTVPGKQRAHFITAMEATQTLVASFTQIGVAFWKNESYLHPVILALVAGVISFVAAFNFPETCTPLTLISSGAAVKLNAKDRAKTCARFLRKCCRLSRRSFAMYLKDDHGRVQKRRIILTVFILTVIVNFCRGGPLTLYRMKYPLCWSATYLLVFSGVQIAVNWAAILLVMVMVRSVFEMADRHIAFIGCLSSFLYMAFNSMATIDVMVYQAAALSILTRAIIPMLRSMLSSQVDKQHQGALYSGLGVIESFGAGVFGLVANRLYTATLDTFAGAVFVLFACIMLLAMVLLGFLNILHRREERPENIDSSSYEAI